MDSNTPVLQIFNESGLDLPFSESELSGLLKLVSREESAGFEMLELAYVGEEEIIRVNKEHLDRDYVTDIISFRYDEDDSNAAIEGTLYCCAQRIAEQAKEYQEPLKIEFLRVFLHGLLHLIGYNDQSKEEKKRMTEKENHYLQAFGIK